MSPTTYRNPYIVGGWVSGPNFYGHDALRQVLLHGPNDYQWVIGTRRVGKTSLLRQLSIEAEAHYIPIYWDMQACQTGDDLSYELFYAIEERHDRFRALGLEVNSLQGADVRELLRVTSRAAEQHGYQILLLIDEPEVLIPISEHDELAVRRLRAALQRPANLRVILSSTKALMRLQEVGRDWLTSAFLAGFAPRNLSGIAPEETTALVRQMQSYQQVEVDDELVETIQQLTNNHPYLVQWLCYRLFQPDGSLRKPTPPDLLSDGMLSALFDLSYKHLSAVERNIILHLLDVGKAHIQQVTETLNMAHDQAFIYLYGLTRLGYTRQIDDGRHYAVGNDFFAQWLENNADKLRLPDVEVPENALQEIAAHGRMQERQYWRQQLQQYRTNLARLEADGATYGTHPPLYIQNHIEEHKLKIKELELRLDALNI